MFSFRPLFLTLSVIAIAATARPASAQDAQSRLWDAAQTGDTAAIRKAVTDGAHVDSLDLRTSRSGRYALNWATLANKVDAVKLLLALKAPVDAENITGFTALQHAAEAGSADAAVVLLAAGADPDHINKNGMSAMDIASARGNSDVAALIQKAVIKKR
jgi:ankyrin repeat protein